MPITRAQRQYQLKAAREEKGTTELPYVWDIPIATGGDAANAKPRRVIATGALLCPPKLVQTVLTTLHRFQTALKRDDAVEVGGITRGKVRSYMPAAEESAAAASGGVCGVGGAAAAPPAKKRGPPTLSVHVSPTAAVAISGGLGNEFIPTELRELITKGVVTWHPGMRIGNPACKGKGPDKYSTFRDEQAAKAKARIAASGVVKPAPLFKYCELFAGIGGFRIGSDNVGGECVFSSEIDHDARCTYAANFGDIPAGDITEYSEDQVPAFDLLTAGFPCQSHSKAGYQRGFDDYRGALFFEVTRQLHYHCPKTFLLENVPNIENVDEGRALALVLEELKNAGTGYDIFMKVIKAYPTVPQARERLYFIGFRSDTGAGANFSWPDMDDTKGNPPPTISSILEDEATVSAEHILSPHKWMKVQLSRKTNGVLSRRIADIHGAARTVCSRYRRGYSHFSEFVPHLLEDGTPKDYQQVYDDLYGDGGVDSAAAAAEEGGEEDGAEDDEDGEGEDKDAFESRRLLQNPRFYTPRETARLMGFPEDFQVVNTMKDAACNNRIYYQLGNAVVPPVIQALVQAIVDTDVYTAAPALP